MSILEILLVGIIAGLVAVVWSLLITNSLLFDIRELLRNKGASQ